MTDKTTVHIKSYFQRVIADTRRSLPTNTSSDFSCAESIDEVFHTEETSPVVDFSCAGNVDQAFYMEEICSAVQRLSDIRQENNRSLLPSKDDLLSASPLLADTFVTEVEATQKNYLSPVSFTHQNKVKDVFEPSAITTENLLIKEISLRERQDVEKENNGQDQLKPAEVNNVPLVNSIPIPEGKSSYLYSCVDKIKPSAAQEEAEIQHADAVIYTVKKPITDSRIRPDNRYFSDQPHDHSLVSDQLDAIAFQQDITANGEINNSPEADTATFAAQEINAVNTRQTRYSLLEPVANVRRQSNSPQLTIGEVKITLIESAEDIARKKTPKKPASAQTGYEDKFAASMLDSRTFMRTL